MKMILIIALILTSATTKSQEYTVDQIEFDVDYHQDSSAVELIDISNIQTDFEDGWNDGYGEGWRDVMGRYAITPIAPVAPIAEPGRALYKDGYNRGFKQGFMDAKRYKEKYIDPDKENLKH